MKNLDDEKEDERIKIGENEMKKLGKIEKLMEFEKEMAVLDDERI